ncbi:MAG TPA: FlgD immunoglobulin-like domain containing protein, partial [Candidatus Krumholzibacteria bacterium]|nr:FlgD immunoglobulin-like domain containing protein [Candidatus Krumholzibacteria bacterium]
VTDAGDHAPRYADFTLAGPVSDVPQLAAAAADLLPASPNPFNPSTRLRFRLERPAAVELQVFDARGRQVRRFPPQTYAPGEHAAVWDGRDDAGRALGSGVFLVRMTARTDAGETTSTGSVTLVE